MAALRKIVVAEHTAVDTLHLSQNQIAGAKAATRRRVFFAYAGEGQEDVICINLAKPYR